MPDVIPFIYRWALESVGAIFLDSRYDYCSLMTCDQYSCTKNQELINLLIKPNSQGGRVQWGVYYTSPHSHI